MEQKRKQQLLKTVRGNNFRRALKAIAELRTSSDAATVSAVAQAAAPDEQRKFQLCVANVVLQKGIKVLVDEWTTLGDAKWRAELISEIGQSVDLWVDKEIIELVLVALNDPDRQVQVKAVWTLLRISKRAVRQGKTSGQKRVATAIPRRRRHGAWLDNDRAAIAHHPSALRHTGAPPPDALSGSASDRGGPELYRLQDESNCDWTIGSAIEPRRRAVSRILRNRRRAEFRLV
jgi:hypothetical protein